MYFVWKWNWNLTSRDETRWEYLVPYGVVRKLSKWVAPETLVPWEQPLPAESWRHPLHSFRDLRSFLLYAFHTSYYHVHNYYEYRVFYLLYIAQYLLFNKTRANKTELRFQKR